MAHDAHGHGDNHAPDSDDHGGHDDAPDSHKEAPADAHQENPSTPSSNTAKACKCDPFFDKVSNYATGKIATFVAFLFFLITIGAIYAVTITRAPLNTVTTTLILAPAAVGLLAYWNRDVAVIIFVAFTITFLIV
ncbi:MAG: hypothetical protein AABW85_05070 [archaeon]